MNKTMKILLACVIAGLLVVLLIFFIWGGDSSEESSTTEKEIAYWVAPMDPNYQRDEPGLSPMGMDLVPIYTEAAMQANEVGVVKISPDVVNNLGVRTGKVSRQLFHTQIKTVGYVQYDEERLVHMHPRVEGWIEKLYTKTAGDPVVKGQPIYELYSPQLVAAQEEFLSVLRRGKKHLIEAVEDRLTALQLSPAFIKELKRSKKIKQTVTFHSPQKGVIDELNIREGSFVKPGNTLLSIAALDEMWVEAEVFESQSAQVEVGLPVTMSLDYWPGEQWEGQVDYVYPALDAMTRTLRVRLRFPNKKAILKPNMFAQVVIHAKAKIETLLIPREAVIRTGDQDRVVLVLGDGRYKSIAVTLGQLGDHKVEVLEGLNVDDAVVISAQFLLDSESSKDSDFKRLHHGEVMQ